MINLNLTLKEMLLCGMLIMPAGYLATREAPQPSETITASQALYIGDNYFTLSSKDGCHGYINITASNRDFIGLSGDGELLLKFKNKEIRPNLRLTAKFNNEDTLQEAELNIKESFFQANLNLDAHGNWHITTNTQDKTPRSIGASFDGKIQAAWQNDGGILLSAIGTPNTGAVNQVAAGLLSQLTIEAKKPSDSCTAIDLTKLLQPKETQVGHGK